MPKKNAIASIPVADLAYAVGRLVDAGKTTTTEVLALAADRGKRIVLLEAELRALRGGGVGRAPAAKAGRPVRTARPAAKRVRKPAPAAKPVAKPATAPGKPLLSAKLRAFRRVQGLYAGYLRGFTGATRERIRTINAEKGPAAALAEMKKLANHGASAKVAAKAAPAKKSAPKVAPERAAARRLQGTYIGMLRNRPEAEKAKLKALAKEKGFKAAIEVMKKGARRSPRRAP